MSKQSRDLWNEQWISKFKDCCVWIHVRLSASSTVWWSLSGGASTGLGKCSLLHHNLTKEKGGVSEATALYWGWILGYREADSISLKSKDPEHAVQAFFFLVWARWLFILRAVLPVGARGSQLGHTQQGGTSNTPSSQILPVTTRFRQTRRLRKPLPT